MNYRRDVDSSATSPNTLNLTDGDFLKVNKQRFNIRCFNVNSITRNDRINQLHDYCRKLNLVSVNLSWMTLFWLVFTQFQFTTWNVCTVTDMWGAYFVTSMKVYLT